ncbi:MAG: LCP family protein [Spirochaetes bacterium]|nr:LCP family protein [Spirochaetota bacterium]
MEILRKLRPLFLVAVALTVAVFATIYIFKFFNRASLEKALNGRDGFSLLFVVTSAQDDKKVQVVSVAQIFPATQRIGVVSFFPATRLKDDASSLEEIFKSKGVSGVSSAVSEFLGERIVAYVKARDNNLAQFVDILGGIDYFLSAADLLKDENLPRGQFILDGSLVSRLLNPPEKNEYTPAFKLFRYYSLFLNAWNQRTRLWPLLKEEKIFALAVKNLETNTSASDLFALSQTFATQKGWVPILVEVPVRRVKDAFHVDKDSVALYLRTLTKQLTQKDHPFVNDPPKMEVKNGTHVANLARTMRTELSRKGVQILEFTNADHNDYEKTILLGTSGNAFYLESIARIMGVQKSYAAVNRSLFTDLVLVLGKDYNKLKGEEVVR